MNNQIDFQNPSVVINAFEALSDKEKIINFMLGYLRYFIISRAKPANLDFKKTIDTVNAELLSPVSNLNSKIDLVQNSEIREKINLWKEAHSAFELRIIGELKDLL